MTSFINNPKCEFKNIIYYFSVEQGVVQEEGVVMADESWNQMKSLNVLKKVKEKFYLTEL